jgi:hypothetical protein
LLLSALAIAAVAVLSFAGSGSRQTHEATTYFDGVVN